MIETLVLLASLLAGAVIAFFLVDAGSGGREWNPPSPPRLSRKTEPDADDFRRHLEALERVHGMGPR